MKNYDEMYRRVLQRRDEHLEKKRKNIIIMKRTFPAAVGFCFALILGISLNANKAPFHKPPAVVEEYIPPTQPDTENDVPQPTAPRTSLPPEDTSIPAIVSTTLSSALSGQPENTSPIQSAPAPEISGEITYTTHIQQQTDQPESAVSRTTRSTTPRTTKTSETTKTKSTSKTSDKTTSAKTSVSVSRTTASSTEGSRNQVSALVTTTAYTNPPPIITGVPGTNTDDPDPVPTPAPPPPIDIVDNDLTIAYSSYDDLARRLLGESSDNLTGQLGALNQWSADVFRDFLQKRHDEMTIMIPYYNDDPLKLREKTPIVLEPAGLFKETWIKYFFPDDNAIEYVKIMYLNGDEISPETYPEYDHSYRTYITLGDRICYAAIGRNNRDPSVYVNFVYDDVLAVMCITESRSTSGFLENFSFRNLQLR